MDRNFNETFVEIECSCRTKDGESVCGDCFMSLRTESDHRHLAVLSDGLGSGIKANLLATMTSTMALKFMKSDMEILQSAEIIMDTLPVCEYRKISYATFTIVDLHLGGQTRIIEMGNPSFIHLRDGKDLKWENRELVSARWPDRRMTLTELKVLPGDRLIICSDGVTQAGLGHAPNKFGWRREGCLRFVQEQLAAEPELSARELSARVVAQACGQCPEHKYMDDTSCLVIYLRRPRKLRLLTGPPFNPASDAEYASLVRDFEGKTIVCGGTTANLVARELKRPIKMDIKLVRKAGGLPPPSSIEGIDLVTEGILTLTEVVRHLEQGNYQQAPLAARQMIELLLASDVIELVVGTKVNDAHLDPNLPVDLEIRRNIVRRLSQVLEENYRKEVKTRYY